MDDLNEKQEPGSTFVVLLEGYSLYYDAERHTIMSELEAVPVDSANPSDNPSRY